MMTEQLQEHTQSWYAATRNTHKIWPKLEDNLDVQICVMGGGFTGINTAIELAERGFKVALLEANRIGWGASGRNGGELIRGIGHNLEQFTAQIGTEGVLCLKQMGIEAVDIVKKRISSHQIDCQLHLGYADLATTSHHMRDLETEVEELERLKYPHSLSLLSQKETHEQVVQSTFYAGSLVDHGSGHLHPLNLILGEAQVAEKLGVMLFEHSPVLTINKQHRPVVHTKTGSVRCDYLVLAGNAYFNPALDKWLGGKILPAGSYILATEPLQPELCATLMPGRKAVADMRTALDYYRFSHDHRLLFGGLCTYSGRDPKDIQAALRPHLNTVFPELGRVKIDYQWGGKIGIGANRLPQIGQLPDAPSIFFAQAYAGHGLNATHLAAKILAEKINQEDTNRFSLFATINHMTFPGGRLLRSPILAAGMLWQQSKELLRFR